MANRTSSIQAVIYYTNGNVTTYQSNDQEAAQHILSSLAHPNKFYTQSTLMVVSGGSLSLIRLSDVYRVDILGDNLPEWAFYHGVTSARIVTDEEFNIIKSSFGDNTAVEPDRKLIKGYIRMEFINKAHIIVEVEIEAPAAILQFDIESFLTKVMETAGAHIPIADGMAMINPAMISNLSFFPAPPKHPAKSWVFE